ncbi:MAG: L-threonylcarbamoyladenylate synthase [Kineosporiaceae bacterium]
MSRPTLDTPERRCVLPVGAEVDVAAERLLHGGLVGMPTETVYGLAADAESPPAVARIYAVKGRPADHPLIVHLATAEVLLATADGDGWARDVPDYARRLAEGLWPGPLTLILRRGPRAGDHVTGGGDSLGLRCPAHPVATALLEAFARAAGRSGAGLAAPSANRFGRVSPTRAGDVVAELGELLDGARDYVLDGGSSRVGVESTILDCTGAAPALLRPGAVSLADVERVGGVEAAAAPRPGVRAPGTLATHYAPRARVLLAEDGGAARALFTELAQTRHRNAAPSVGLLALDAIATPDGVVRLAAPPRADGYAHALYAALREADALGLTEVVAVPPPALDALSAAVTDRLRRAAAGTR